MHRHDDVGWKEIVHRRKNGFLDLSGIRTSSYQDDLSREIDCDHRFASRAVALGVGPEGGAAINGELRNEGREFLTVWPEQQRADEQRIPGERSEDTRP